VSKNKVHVSFFGGSLEGNACKVPADKDGIPMRVFKTDTDVYHLTGYDEYTWRYVVAAPMTETSEAKNDG
jgi:hypothetical protein